MSEKSSPERRPGSGQAREHHERTAPLIGLLEPVPLVEVERRVVRLDAEAEPRKALRAGALDQGLEQLRTVALPAHARDDGDRQLRGLLVDEAVAGLVGREEPVPGGADRLEALDRDDGRVAPPPPALDVA